MKQTDFAHELPTMDFQDQCFHNIIYRIQKKYDFKFLGKKKANGKVLLTLVPKLRALYYRAKQKTQKIKKNKKLSRDNTLENLLFKNSLSLNRYKKPLTQKDRSVKIDLSSSTSSNYFIKKT